MDRSFSGTETKEKERDQDSPTKMAGGIPAARANWVPEWADGFVVDKNTTDVTITPPGEDVIYVGERRQSTLDPRFARRTVW